MIRKREKLFREKGELVTDKDGNITDVTVSYNEDYVEQMLRYSKDYSPLPSVNN